MLTRRRFLTQSGVLLAGASLAPAFLARAARAIASGTTSSAYGDDTILVVIQLSGGNDGLNTVVPFGLDGYAEARPTIAIAEGDALPLTDSIGLHPELGRLRDRYQAGQVAIVQGVGYPNQILSHFAAMDIWQRADPDPAATDGWLADYLAATDAMADSPMYAASVTDVLAPALRGRGVTVPAIAGLQAYQLRTDPRYPADRDQRLAYVDWVYGHSAATSPLERAIAKTGAAALESASMVQQAAQAYSSDVDYPTFPLGNSLKTVAQLIAGDLGTRIYFVAFGGFDTHAAQPETHARLLGGFSDSVDAFLQDVEGMGYGNRVLLMTFSEFGRRVQENGSRGTDHGTAAPMFVIGPQVKGGLYGEHPSLLDLDDNRNLRFAIDFRAVYGTVLEGWLGADQQSTLGARYENIGFV